MDDSGTPKLGGSMVLSSNRSTNNIARLYTLAALVTGPIPHCLSRLAPGTDTGIHRAHRQAALAREVFLSSRNLNALRLDLRSPETIVLLYIPACALKSKLSPLSSPGRVQERSKTVGFLCWSVVRTKGEHSCNILIKHGHLTSIQQSSSF